MATNLKDGKTAKPSRGSHGGNRSGDRSKSGGDQARNAQEWGGGSKAAKGPITDSDRRNPNSSQKS